MIRRIELKNWKSHEETVLNFGKGINLFLGNIGTGKTSVIDAISFSLFHDFPDLNSRRIKIEDVIMNKPVQKSFSKIVLEFENNGKIYKIEKTIERNFGSKAELKEGNKIVESGVENVKEFIQKILKIDYRTFCLVTYVQQNNLLYILDLPKGERKVEFDKMLGIEKLEVARKATVSLKNRIFETIRILRENVKGKDLEALKNEINELKNEIENLKKQVEIKKENYLNVVERIEKIKEKIESFEKIKNEIENLKILIIKNETLQKELSEREKDLEKYYKEKEKIFENLKKIENEINNSKNILEKLKKEFEEKENFVKEIEIKKERIKEKINYLESQIEELNIYKKEYDELKNENFEIIENLRNELIELESHAKHLDMLIYDLKNSLEMINKAYVNCPVCNSFLSEEKKVKIKIEKEEQIRKAKEKQKEILNKVEELKKKIKILEEKKRKFELLSEKFKNYEKIENELNKLKEEFKNLNEIALPNLNEIKNEIETLKNKINDLLLSKKDLENRIEKVKEYEKIKEKLEKVLSDLNFLNLKLNDLKSKFDENEYENLKNEIEKLNKRESELKTEIVFIENLIKEKEKRFEDKNKEFEKLQKNLNEINRLEKIYKDLEILEKALKEVQEIVRNELINTINIYLSKIWKSFYPYKDYKDLRLIATEDDYILEVLTSQNKWVEINKIASGGEKTIASICLRFALAKTIAPQIDFIILDEPTHNLDEKTVQEFANFLNNYANQIFDQIFIITHDEKFEKLLNANIYRFYRDKENDLPTKVEEIIL